MNETRNTHLKHEERSNLKEKLDLDPKGIEKQVILSLHVECKIGSSGQPGKDTGSETFFPISRTSCLESLSLVLCRGDVTNCKNCKESMGKDQSS